MKHTQMRKLKHRHLSSAIQGLLIRSKIWGKDSFRYKMKRSSISVYKIQAHTYIEQPLE